LRGRLNFQGVIFSDDLSMEAAGIGGSYGERARLAIDAGCDMVLVCNHPDGVAEVIEALGSFSNPVSQLRLTRMHGKGVIQRDELLASSRWRRVTKMIAELDDSPWLELDV
jgi:beta-N-acetylhexosaminidase